VTAARPVSLADAALGLDQIPATVLGEGQLYYSAAVDIEGLVMGQQRFSAAAISFFVAGVLEH
jgi:hypothetical protein